MRSLSCSRPSYVRFFNLSPNRVDIIWINYEGIGVTYKTLNPREYHDVNTFVSHPWIFRNSSTFDAMTTFTAEGHKRNDLVFKPIETSSRKIVFITLPFYSLKERCFRRLRDLKLSDSDIAGFEIPRTLKDDYNFFLKNGHTVNNGE
ncbi:von Hippel-Lindau disease tumor suppressor-like protein [Leptotrombidium deliense]|uniref:von Hippel-Lindau disease tumor suppressor-like protein n=1 Tax=Leptotrombidium deliense TaxID=299467 RepID=A0A443SU67_9ACAR|nr:von Hippel-Lindau disease tumor suppressor-like protein [Leptotrombidium deliense]